MNRHLVFARFCATADAVSIIPFTPQLSNALTIPARPIPTIPIDVI
jgi:hypothetical protein